MSDFSLNNKLGLGLVVAFFALFIGGGIAYRYWPAKTVPAHATIPQKANTDVDPPPARLKVAAAKPPRMKPNGTDDGVFRSDKEVAIYSGYGVLHAGLPVNLRPFEFTHRDLGAKLDEMDRTLFDLPENTGTMIRDAGVTKEGLIAIRKIRLADATGKLADLATAFIAYENAPEGPAKQAALESVKTLLSQTGQAYIDERQKILDARKALFTPEQYAAFTQLAQKAITQREQALQAERDLKASQQQARDKATAAENPDAVRNNSPSASKVLLP